MALPGGYQVEVLRTHNWGVVTWGREAQIGLPLPSLGRNMPKFGALRNPVDREFGRQDGHHRWCLMYEGEGNLVCQV